MQPLNVFLIKHCVALFSFSVISVFKCAFMLKLPNRKFGDVCSEQPLGRVQRVRDAKTLQTQSKRLFRYCTPRSVTVSVCLSAVKGICTMSPPTLFLYCTLNHVYNNHLNFEFNRQKKKMRFKRNRSLLPVTFKDNILTCSTKRPPTRHLLNV